MIESKELLPAPQDVGQALAYAQELSKSELLPTVYKGKPQNILIAMMWSKSIGMPTIQGLNSIAVINGRASLFGDALKALVMSSGLCEDFAESFDEQATTATCRIKRRGIPTPTVATFSYKEAGEAGLRGKDGPWKRYPKRMCQMRARAFAIRDAFPDLLMGIAVAEEMQDEVSIEGAAGETPATELSTAKKMPRRKKKEAAQEVVDIAEQPTHDLKPVEDQTPAPATSVPPAPELAEEEVQAADVQTFDDTPDVTELMKKITLANSYAEILAIWKSVPRESRPAIQDACSKRNEQLKAAAQRSE